MGKRLFGGMLVWLPTGLMAVWGTQYVIRAYDAFWLRPEAYSMRFPAGVTEQEALIWGPRVDWARSAFSAKRFEVREVDQESWLAGREVTARRTPTGALEVDLGSAWARIRREKGGAFAIERLLKGPPQPPSNDVRRIRVGEATLVWDDRDAGERRSARAKDATIWNHGDLTHAGFALSAGDLGQFNLRLRTWKDQLVLEGRGQAEASAALPFLRRLRETRGIRELAQLQLDPTPFRADFAVEKRGDQVRLSARVDGTSERVRFDRYVVRQGQFAGVLTERGFAGEASGQAEQMVADWRGALTWDRPALVGTYQARGLLPGWVDLPRRTQVGKVQAKGWLAWDGKKVRALSSANLAGAQFEGFRLRDGQGTVAWDGDRLATRIDQASVGGTRFSGGVGLDKGQLRGGLRAPSVDFGGLAASGGVKGLSGRGEGAVFFTGERAEVRARGRLVTRATGRPINLGQVSAVARWEKDRLDILRASAVGPTGRASVAGRFVPRGQALNLDVRARGVDLGIFAPDIEGQASFAGTVSGRGQNLTARGRTESFGVRTAGETVDYVTAEIDVNGKSLRAQDVVAFDQGARATGTFGLEFETEKLSGQLDVAGVQLDKYPPENLSGSVALRRGILSGTLSKPSLVGDLEGVNLVAGGFRIGQIAGRLNYAADTIWVDQLIAEVAEGEIRGQIHLKPSTRQGDFTMTAQRIDVGLLAPELAKQVSLEGRLSGDVNGSFGEKGLLALLGKGTVDSLKVNKTLVGSGDFDVRRVNDRYEGRFLVGQLDQFVEATRLSYDPERRLLDADLIASGVPLRQLYDLGAPYLPVENETASWRGPLRSLEGSIAANLSIAGSLDNPILDVKQLDVKDMKVEGTEAGDLSVKFNKTDQIWTFEQLEWGGGPGKLSAKGTVDEKGDIRVSGSLTDFRANWLAWLDPSFANLNGTFGSDLFSLEGKTDNPTVAASLNYTERKEGAEVDRQIDLLARIENARLTADGTFFFGGFTGPITASAPLKYPLTEPQTGPLTAEIQLDSRKITDLKELLTGLDVPRTQGRVGGKLFLEGPFDALAARGSLNVTPDGDQPAQIALNGLETMLQEVQAALNFNLNEAKLDFSAKGSNGGDLKATGLGIGIRSLPDLFARGIEELLNAETSGDLEANALVVRYQDKSAGLMTGRLDGGLNLSGALRNPLIKGEVLFSKASLAIPSVQAAEQEPPDFLVNPAFDILFATSEPFTLRAGAGNFTLNGNGSLKGSLEQPELESLFKVRKGSLRLPNARIGIEEDGEIAVTVRGDRGGQVARADMNLIGRTQLTSVGVNGVPQRYDITLGITGNLLEENGLILNASSDPPDLNQDRILALLGQRDLVAGSTDPTRQIQNALLGAAVPYFAGNFIDPIATTLGLDYLNIDYNVFDGFSLSAAFSLNRDVTVSARRQISAPLPGLEPRYELRVSYRPVFAGKIGRRFSLSYGLDQDRPWKLSLEYGFRF